MELYDWLVIGLFCLALIGIVVWVVSKKNNDSADYFLGGRDATWIAIGASIFASNIGSEHLIGPALYQSRRESQAHQKRAVSPVQ